MLEQYEKLYDFVRACCKSAMFQNEDDFENTGKWQEFAHDIWISMEPDFQKDFRYLYDVTMNGDF